MKQNSLQPLRQYLFGLLSIAGLSFWFMIGFPFENHNESFAWVVQLQERSFADLFTEPVWPVATFRPLGIMTAWLGYRWFHASIYPQQLFNYFVAIGAWLLLFTATKEKRVFSFVAFAVGGAFFSGYLYLFHLHGVFYSPLLLWVAFLLANANKSQQKKGTWFALLLLAALLISLYHPFALLLFAAFVGGHLLTTLPTGSIKQRLLDLLYIVGALVPIKLVVPAQEGMILNIHHLQGLITSYALVELNLALAIVAYSLSLITLLSITNLALTWRLGLSAAVTLLAYFLFILQVPVLLLWLAIALLKVVLKKEWYFACLLVCTALLPLITATGSPTYTIFALMVAAVITVMDSRLLEQKEPLSSTLAVAALATMLVLVLLINSGRHLPMLSTLVAPLLAEKEKTYQIKELLAWIAHSDESMNRVTLCQHSGSPTASTNAADRRYRPPTSQEYLDVYIDSVRGGQPESDSALLVLCFGGERITEGQLIHAVAGKESGEATILKLSP